MRTVGGAAAVGAAALARMLPAGLAAPFAGALVDRCSRRDVVLGSCLGRAAVLAAIRAAVLGSAPFALVLVLAALFTVLATAHKPAQAALLPSLAETPRQLAAANAVSNGLDNAAFPVGSLVSGVFIATVGVDRVFWLTAALFAGSALPITGIRRDPVPGYRSSEEGGHAVSDAVEAFRTVADDRALRLIVGLDALSTVIEGAVDVLLVVVAIQLLRLGGSGVGWLNACWGVGGVVGGAAALGLLRRGRLAAGLASGSLLIGLPLVLFAAAPSVAAAVAMLVVLGVGYSLIEVASLSLLQRLTSNDLLGRAFAVLESSYWITTGLGAILAPVLVHLLGVRSALVLVGACLPVLVLLRWAPLARFEAGAIVPELPFKALRALPLFEPLVLATIENVSCKVAELHVLAGETVIHEGDYGDRFYVVVQGSLDVTRERGVYPAMAAGDFFGEIALLRDVPRTATVTARDDCLLYAIDRESFLFAVGSHASATRVADEVASERLARVPVA